MSGRASNEGYYQDMPRTNYNSREFQAGIFTNELNRKAETRHKKEDIQLELTEVVDYSNGKVKNSKKQFEYSRQSGEESGFKNHQDFDVNALDERQLKAELREEMQLLRKETEYSVLDKVKKMMNDNSAKVRESIGDLVTQTNNGFKKKE